MSDNDLHDDVLKERLDSVVAPIQLHAPAASQMAELARRRERRRRLSSGLLAVAVAVIPVLLIVFNSEGPSSVVPSSQDAETWTTDLGAPGSIVSAVAADDSIWVAVNDDTTSRVVRLSTATGDVLESTPMASRILSLAVDRGVAWVLRADPAVEGGYFLERAGGEPSESIVISAGRVVELAVNDSLAYVASASYPDGESARLLGVDLPSQTVTTSVRLPSSIPQSVFVSANTIDVSTVVLENGGFQQGMLVRIPSSLAGSGAIVDNFAMGASTPDGVSWGARLTSDGYELSYCDAGSTEVSMTGVVGLRYMELSVSGDSVWMINDNGLTRFNSSDGSTRSYSFPGSDIEQLTAIPGGVVMSLGDGSVEFQSA